MPPDPPTCKLRFPFAQCQISIQAVNTPAIQNWTPPPKKKKNPGHEPARANYYVLSFVRPHSYSIGL